MNHVPIGNLLFFTAFLLVGLLVLVSTIVKPIIAKIKYEKVNGVCVRVDTHIGRSNRGRRTTTFKPVWQYDYTCEQYESSMSGSSSFMNVPVGEERTIYVNPDNPMKIYVFFIGDIIFSTIIGSLFFAIGVGCLVNLLK